MKRSRKIVHAAILLPCLFVSNPAVAKSDRLAVVIANGNYSNIGALRNPVSDGRLVADSLRASGFEVRLYEDLGEQQIRKASLDIAKTSGSYEVTLVYYAGHGVQISGVNFLLPVDLPPPEVEDDIKLTSISADDLLAAIKSPYKVIVLDACRDNPVVSRGLTRGRSASLSRGLAPPSSPEIRTGGVFIAYSTQADAVAVDGDGQYSPFADSFSRYVGRSVSIDDMFALVTRDVLRDTRGQQRPFKYASLDSIFCLPGVCGQSGEPAEKSPRANDVNQKPLTLADEFTRLATLSPTSPEAARLELDMRSKRNAQFGPLVVYGTLDDKGATVVYGFVPESLERLDSGFAANVRIGLLKRKKIEWDPGFSRYAINCAGKTLEQQARQTGDDTFYLSQAERQQSRFTANEGSVAESLTNLHCDPIIASTPIASDEDKWVPVGNLNRTKNDTVTMATAAIRTAPDIPDVKYVQFKTAKFVNRDGEVPGMQGLSLTAIDCSKKAFMIVSDYQLNNGTITQALAFSAKWAPIGPGSITNNAYVLICENTAAADVESGLSRSEEQ